MYKYNYDTYSTLDELLDAVTEEIEDTYEMKIRYNVMLNECTGDGNGLNIAGLIYVAAYVLQEIDPIAYFDGLRDYMDGYIADLRNMDETTVLNELRSFEIDVEELETEEIQGN